MSFLSNIVLSYSTQLVSVNRAADTQLFKASFANPYNLTMSRLLHLLEHLSEALDILLFTLIYG
jgi:hypothetical protein